MLTQLDIVLLDAMPALARRSLRLSALAPALSADIRTATHTNPPRSVVAPRSPGPASAARDGKVVEAEAEPTSRDADQAAKEQIEAKVAVVGEARAGDVDCGADGDEDEDERVDGWCGILVADGDNVFLCVGWGGERRLLLVDWEGAGALPEIGGRNCRGEGWICAIWAWWEERDSDGELGGEEKSEIEETSP